MFYIALEVDFTETEQNFCQVQWWHQFWHISADHYRTGRHSFRYCRFSSKFTFTTYFSVFR